MTVRTRTAGFNPHGRPDRGRPALQARPAKVDGEGVKDSLPIAGRAMTVSRSALGRSARAILATPTTLARVPASAGPPRSATRGLPSPRLDVMRTRRGLAVARVLLPLLGVGMLVAGIVFSMKSRERTWTESEVVQEMRRIALEGGRAETPMAGGLGPLRIAAGTIDAVSGDFLDFRIESARMMVTARRAVLTVDPHRDTFAFDLHDVVFTRVPEIDGDGSGAADEGGTASDLASGGPVDIGSFVHTTDRHLFGPADFGQNIVPDGPRRSGGGGVAGPRPGGGFAPRGANASESPNTGWLRDAGAN